jgi:hypothetical protein
MYMPQVCMNPFASVILKLGPDVDRMVRLSLPCLRYEGNAALPISSELRAVRHHSHKRPQR